MEAPPHSPMRSFGRLKSRPIKPRQEALLKSLLPTIAVPDPSAGLLDPRALAPGCRAVTLEIGFGGGEHLAAQAARAPDVLFLGAEPFVNGVASALRHVDEGGLTNVRIHQGDARDLVGALPSACLETVFILFPDPWPKRRHHKRRLIQSDFLDELGRVVAPGGRVRFATDWADYADQALARFIASPHFAWTARRADDWRRPPADHITTRYEQKALGDCAPIFFDFVRASIGPNSSG
jgi:tRNA (guanine-N7-)-methyltransferase